MSQNSIPLSSMDSILFWRSPSKKCACVSTPSICVPVTGEIIASCIAVHDSQMNTYFPEKLATKSSCEKLSTSIRETLLYVLGCQKYGFRIFVSVMSSRRFHVIITSFISAIGSEYTRLVSGVIDPLLDVFQDRYGAPHISV